MFEYYAVAVVVGLLLYFLISRDDNSKEPPGPRPWPILGNLIDLATASPNVILAMGVLAEKYGEIYSLRMGMKRTVILTSKEAMQTITTNESALHRDRVGMFEDRSFHKNLGIAFSNGEMWEKSRTWTFKNLREFGFGKSLEMEHHVQNSIQSLCTRIDTDMISSKGAVDSDLLFNPPIMAIMWQMIVGRLSTSDKEDIETLITTSVPFVRSSIFGTGIVNAYPFLRFIFPNWLGYNVQMFFFNTCNEVAKKLFYETESRLKDSSAPATSLLEAFIQNCTSKDDMIFNCENFQLIFQDLLLASTDTTSSFVESMMLYLISYPETQEKIYQEILEIAPDGRSVEFADRKRMTYTQGFILESHRYAAPLQNGVPRKASNDFYYKNYLIKKGTVIIVDMRLYFEDKTIWTDPEVFRPERFINEKGEIYNASNVIAFGFGKRMCPGELQANVVSFLLLTSLIQRYKLSVPQGHPKPSMEKKAGLTIKPMPFQVAFTKRNK